MIGLIVDGPGDFAAFKARFKEKIKVLKTDGPRGHNVDPSDIVSSARKQIAMLNYLGCRHVMIVTDYEDRQINYQKFISDLTREVSTAKFNICVRVASPNKMIENWYLADIEQLSKKFSFIKQSLQQRKYEGKNGKKELRKLFKKGHDYNEVEHGPKLFITLRTNISQANSLSFRMFLNDLSLCQTSKCH